MQTVFFTLIILIVRYECATLSQARAPVKHAKQRAKLAWLDTIRIPSSGVFAHRPAWFGGGLPKAAQSIPIAGVDVETEDGIDFYGLGAAGGGTEFPAGKGGHDLGGHGGGAGFEDLQIL